MNEDQWGTSIMTATGVLETQREYNDHFLIRLEHIREIMERILTSEGVMSIQWDEHQTTPDSVYNGAFDGSAVLRPNDDEGDDMGRDLDPDTQGSAEMWFRKFRGDEE